MGSRADHIHLYGIPAYLLSGCRYNFEKNGNSEFYGEVYHVLYLIPAACRYLLGNLANINSRDGCTTYLAV